MKIAATSALVLCLSTVVASAGEKVEKKEGISISFSSEDKRTRLAPRHVTGKARLAVTTRGGAAVLLLTNDVVAVQLSEAVIGEIEPDDDAGFLEELVASGVRLAIGKSVEYPIASIRSAEIRNGVLTLTNDEGKPVFDLVKVNGENVTRDLSPVDAARFVQAFRLVKSGR